MTTAPKHTTTTTTTSANATSATAKRDMRIDTNIGDAREQAIQHRQKEAAESKARTLAMYDNMAKSDDTANKPDKQEPDDNSALGSSNCRPPATKTSPIKGRPTNPKDALLHWCYMKTRSYDNVYVENFSSSWADGLAFCALLHHFFPKDIDYAKLSSQSRRENFDLAFKVAEDKAKVYPLLETDDMIKMGDKPDWKCVYTYVQALYRGLKPFDPTQK